MPLLVEPDRQGQNDVPLARDLYRTGNSDAIYLAGLICDGRQLSGGDLNDWAKQATWHMLGEMLK